MEKLHSAGSFCWFELGTTDSSAAKNFYSSLFGWTTVDSPMGDSGFVYTTFLLDGKRTGGCYTLMPDMLAQGVPPHWMEYVCVDSADASSEKAKAAGGTVINGPFDVRDYGRMSIIHDPTGAHFGIWQPNSHTGSEIAGVPGTFCWTDLMTSDVTKAAQFYETLFGWEIEQPKEGSDYIHIKNGEQHIGGIPPARFLPPNVPPHWLAYVLVTDCDSSTSQAQALGAKVVVPAMSMEDVGRWSIIADPQGAVFALFQSAH